MILKAGTYRFNDVLTPYTDTERLNIKSGVEINGKKCEQWTLTNDYIYYFFSSPPPTYAYYFSGDNKDVWLSNIAKEITISKDLEYYTAGKSGITEGNGEYFATWFVGNV